MSTTESAHPVDATHPVDAAHPVDAIAPVGVVAPADAVDPVETGHAPTGADHAAAGPGLAALSARRFAAVLFDLDGTLIDSTDAVERSWQRWAAERGIARSSFTISHGVPARQVLARFLPPDEVAAAFTRIEEIEVAQVDGIVVLPGAAQALAALPSGRAAIVTSGTPPLVRARLAATGLRPPPVLVTADDVAVGKPDPAPYLLAARRLGVDPGDCLVVEDAPAGVAAGRAAGCATLAVLTTHLPAELPADAAIGSLDRIRFVADPDGDGVRLVVDGEGNGSGDGGPDPARPSGARLAGPGAGDAR